MPVLCSISLGISLEKQKILRYFIQYYDLKMETFVLQLFELLPLTENINDTLKRSIYISANLLIIYIYCYLGQKLINNSTGLLRKCCQIPFYALSIKTRKMLLLLMVASLKPSTFSMSGIIVASHEMFTKMMRSSLSFAMVCYKARQ
ncbi:odorant receptor 47a-like [Vespula squamosa]|uniref:Odorant receptor 47a-like n=1 Tax=Vespula squamosa TaxID=30214 RepID=A0ABD2BMZ0_VESSQ